MTASEAISRLLAWLHIADDRGEDSIPTTKLSALVESVEPYVVPPLAEPGSGPVTVESLLAEAAEPQDTVASMAEYFEFLASAYAFGAIQNWNNDAQIVAAIYANVAKEVGDGARLLAEYVLERDSEEEPA